MLILTVIFLKLMRFDERAAYPQWSSGSLMTLRRNSGMLKADVAFDQIAGASTGA